MGAGRNHEGREGAQVGEQPTVLVTDDISGQNRGALATVRALAGTRYRVVVTVGDRRSLAAASRYCTGTVRLPSGGEPHYARALRTELATGRHHVFFPASDVSMIAVDDPVAELVDKSRLDALARQAGFDCLPTRVFDSASALRAAAAELGYPLVVKSATKSGLSNLQAVTIPSAGELRQVADVPGTLVAQPFQGGGLRAVSGVIHDGELLAVCHQEYRRIWPPRAGVASFAVTIAGRKPSRKPGTLP